MEGHLPSESSDGEVLRASQQRPRRQGVGPGRGPGGLQDRRAGHLHGAPQSSAWLPGVLPQLRGDPRPEGPTGAKPQHSGLQSSTCFTHTVAARPGSLSTVHGSESSQPKVSPGWGSVSLLLGRGLLGAGHRCCPAAVLSQRRRVRAPPGGPERTDCLFETSYAATSIQRTKEGPRAGGYLPPTCVPRRTQQSPMCGRVRS